MTKASRPAALALGALAAVVLAAPPAAAHDSRSAEGRAEARRVLADYVPTWERDRAVTGTPVPCADGTAAGYPCRNVDLLSVLPLRTIGGGASTSSMWHWKDSAGGREYILLCRSNGISFIDVTDPVNPVYVGNLPSHGGTSSSWRDVRVYRDTAYVGADGIESHGLQVFDLRRLRGVTSPQTFDEDRHYDQIGNIHTISIDVEAGVLHAVGSNTCGSGNHMIDIREPLAPKLIGCYSGDGYVHENVPERYTGPDTAHVGKHITFNYSVKHFTIVDVTDPKAPKLIGKGTYEGASYIHQGDRTGDWRYVVQNDELISTAAGSPSFVWDISDLDDPRLVRADRSGGIQAIRHNQYRVGSLMYQAAYKAGLRIHDAAGLPAAYPEIGYFDVYGKDDSAGFAGTWQVNPFLSNGTVAVSSMEGGLFLVRPTGAARNPVRATAAGR